MFREVLLNLEQYWQKKNEVPSNCQQWPLVGNSRVYKEKSICKLKARIHMKF